MSQNLKLIEREEVKAMTWASLLLVAVTVVLYLFGIVMVFSASSVELK